MSRELGKPILGRQRVFDLYGVVYCYFIEQFDLCGQIKEIVQALC